MKPMVNLVKNWRCGIKAADFKLHHETPEVFIQCQWQKGLGISLTYLIYRILLAATFFGILVSSVCDTGKSEAKSINGDAKYDLTTSGDTEVSSTETIFLVEKDKNVTEELLMDTGSAFIYKWPIYLTNWGIAICTAQAVLGAVIVIQKKLAENKLDGELKSKMSFSYKCYWALHTTATVTAPAITILYWTLVYKKSRGPPSAVGVLVHGINSILMLIDLSLVAHPHRFQHFYFPLLMSFIYFLFTIIYYLAGGTNRHKSHKIYPQLDWSKPFTLALPTAAGGLILLIVLHSLMYGFSELKSYLGQKLKTPRCLYIGEGNDNKGASISINALDSIEVNGANVSKGISSQVIIMNNV